MKKLLLVAVAIFFLACEEETDKLRFIEGSAFGTTYHITYYGSEPVKVQKAIDSIVEAINKSASTYMEKSDISRINKGDTTVVVDDFFKEVFKLSERINVETAGYFDPTIGVLRNAYGFGEEKPLKNIDDNRLDSLLQYVGFHKVKLNEDGTISKEYPEIYFDFNAIAKGLGVDYIGRYLDKIGISDYLIEVGGEILAKGENPEKKNKWTVGIEKPDSDLENRSYDATVHLSNEGMAASGNYRKFRVDSLSGKKYVHTINPLNGSAVMSDVTSATVIAPTCAEADAYATSFMAMGLEMTKNFVSEIDGVEVYLTYINPDGSDGIYVTDGFKKRMP
ncbi:MAG TPA: FAD:protein FMN transferase [Flavobacteriaceae bacterium]|nr:FAD:protein FMN transferase [Flavobacteriaceae bacterium]